MMTEQKIPTGQAAEDTISFATLPDQIVVIRVSGRGSFHNSVEMRRLAEAMGQRPGVSSPRFVIDLIECITMDSTFMGVLASMGLCQLKALGEKMVITNANEQNMRLLKTLGLSQFMTVREFQAEAPEGVKDGDFRCLATEEVSRTDRIVHMIEAHQELCDVDPSNNLRFESVLKYLHDSLEREK